LCALRARDRTIEPYRVPDAWALARYYRSRAGAIAAESRKLSVGASAGLYMDIPPGKWQ
jgi:hypothetical protein